MTVIHLFLTYSALLLHKGEETGKRGRERSLILTTFQTKVTPVQNIFDKYYVDQLSVNVVIMEMADGPLTNEQERCFFHKFKHCIHLYMAAQAPSWITIAMQWRN